MTTETPKSGKVRSSHNLIYEQIRSDLRAMGYDPIRPIFLDRFMRFRMIIVAVNHLATILHHEPYRVYQALLVRVYRAMRGHPFSAYRQAQPTAEGLLEEERRGGLHVLCPCCGADLLEQGKVTRAEVSREIHHKTATSRSKKHILNVQVPTSEGVSGAGGPGGGDPDRGRSAPTSAPSAVE